MVSKVKNNYSYITRIHYVLSFVSIQFWLVAYNEIDYVICAKIH